MKRKFKNAEIRLGAYNIDIMGETLYAIELYTDYPSREPIACIYLPRYTDNLFYRCTHAESVTELYAKYKTAPELTGHLRTLKEELKRYVSIVFETRRKYNLD